MIDTDDTFLDELHTAVEDLYMGDEGIHRVNLHAQEREAEGGLPGLSFDLFRSRKAIVPTVTVWADHTIEVGPEDAAEVLIEDYESPAQIWALLSAPLRAEGVLS